MDILRSWINEDELAELIAFLQAPVLPEPPAPDPAATEFDLPDASVAEGWFASEGGDGFLFDPEDVVEVFEVEEEDILVPRSATPDVQRKLSDQLARIYDQAAASGALGDQRKGVADSEILGTGQFDRVDASLDDRVDGEAKDAKEEVERKFRPPQLPLPMRFEALGQWIEQEFGWTRFFVADERGYLVHTRGVERDIISSSSSLAEACRRTRRHLPEIRGGVHVDLGSQGRLCLVPCPCSHSPLTVGLMVEEVADGESVERVAVALRAAVDGSLG